MSAAAVKKCRRLLCFAIGLQFATVSGMAQMAPVISQSFNPPTIPVNETSFLSIAIANPNSGAFNLTGAMITARAYHSATQLNNGTVLIAGGQGNTNGYLAAAELYNPATATFAATANLNTARIRHTATLLNNGKVLIVGGEGLYPFSVSLASAELYDPATGAFTLTGSMSVARLGHTATLLNNGKVLVTGGQNLANPNASLATAELYDPAARTFTLAATMITGRAGHTATLLNDGTVLITGGGNPTTPLASVEIYNPATATFTAAGSMASPRAQHTATLLNNGKVLVTGGGGSNQTVLSLAELYDPVARVFTATGAMTVTRTSHAATLLNNNQVLVAGGLGGTGLSVLNTAELYNPATGTFTATGKMTAAREFYTMTLLSNGNGAVLMAGASNGSTYLASAELYGSVTLNGVGFTETLPAGIIPLGTTSLSGCGGGKLATMASGNVTLAGATIAGGGTCFLGVTVTGTALGTYTAVTGAVTSANGGTGSTASATLLVSPLLPAITAYSPTSVPAGSAAFTLTLSGTNFCGSSEVFWNSTLLTATFIPSTSIFATIPANLLTSPATAAITVFNPPGACAPGGTSPGINFVVAGASSQPTSAVTVQPPVLRPAAPAGSTTPVMNSVNLRNVSGAPLTTPLASGSFSVSGGPGWLQTIPQTATDLKSGMIRFTTNPTGLASGSYLGYIVYPGLGPLGGNDRPHAVSPQCNQVSTAVVFTVGTPALTFTPLNPTCCRQPPAQPPSA